MAQPGDNQTPEWVSQLHAEPEWVKALTSRTTPPPRAGNTGGGYEAGRQDQELLTAIRAMPDQVVSALRSAIEAATPQQQAPPPNTSGTTGQQQAGQQQAGQQQAAPGQQAAPPEQQGQHDTAPRAQETFADKWFGNKLFT